MRCLGRCWDRSIRLANFSGSGLGDSLRLGPGGRFIRAGGWDGNAGGGGGFRPGFWRLWQVLRSMGCR